FYLRQVIGRGAFGQVRIVEHKESQGTYALKTISKSKCTVKQSHINILRERALLEDIDHPFVTPLRFSFQDALNVYVVTDLMAGGDLRFHIKSRRFTENIVRFWVAELACALNYLHTVHGVVHRDVKPENVLMDRRGHVALADFNAAVGVGNGTVYSKTGTPSYMAPEVFGNAGYSYSVDWWSLGIVMYECIYGRRPFRSNSRAAPQEIAADEVAFPVTVDQRITLDCMSAIRGLLHKEPMSRLGCGAQGMTRLKRHPFFATLDWELLEARELCPIFVPDTQAFNNYDVGRLSAADLAASDAPPSRESTMQSDDELDRSCPMLKKLEAEFFDFNYIEYQRFKNY
ncbi:kinase-like domain-containing protein, partial [Coemansia spiralis]